MYLAIENGRDLRDYVTFVDAIAYPNEDKPSFSEKLGFFLQNLKMTFPTLNSEEPDFINVNA